MKIFKKLDARGFAHHLILVAVVLVVAVGGTYYLVDSHADTCPTSGPVSGSDCTPPLTYLAGCSISGVPATIQSDTDFTPHILVTNVGTGLITPTINYSVVNAQTNSGGVGSIGPQTSGSLASTDQIAPGISQSFIVLQRYIPPVNVAATYSLNVSVTVSGNGSSSTSTCSAPFSVVLPLVQSVTINPTDWQTLTHASVTTDKPQGSVIKLNASTKSSLSSVSTNQGTTLLGKLVAFMGADYDQKAQLCVTARSTGSSQLSVVLQGPAGQSATVASLTASPKTTYSASCVNFTIGNYKTNSGTITVQNNAGSAISYVSKVTLTLQ
jgi:hypothetical protein